MLPLAVLVRLVVSRIGWFLATGDERDAEILALRHQVLVLQRQINRPRFTDTDRTVLAILSRTVDRRRLAGVFLIVKPETMIGWHRRFVALHWTQTSARPGRPRVGAEIRQLAIRMARENPTWGYRRVHGEIARLGYRVAQSTIWKILRTAGIDPTPNRTGPGWAEFIRSQAKAIIATEYRYRSLTPSSPAQPQQLTGGILQKADAESTTRFRESQRRSEGSVVVAAATEWLRGQPKPDVAGAFVFGPTAGSGFSDGPDSGATILPDG